MPVVRFPYGKETLSCEIPETRYAGTLVSGLEEYHPAASERALVEEALRHPYASAPLSELAAGKKKVVVICSDHTRPVPSKLLIPPMLREIRKGNPDAEITLLIATGCHRETKREELLDKFGLTQPHIEKVIREVVNN